MSNDDKTEAFIEYQPAEVGYNLRHWRGWLHITGEDCKCEPGKVPHRSDS